MVVDLLWWVKVRVKMGYFFWVEGKEWGRGGVGGERVIEEDGERVVDEEGKGSVRGWGSEIM